MCFKTTRLFLRHPLYNSKCIQTASDNGKTNSKWSILCCRRNGRRRPRSSGRHCLFLTQRRSHLLSGRTCHRFRCAAFRLNTSYSVNCRLQRCNVRYLHGSRLVAVSAAFDNVFTNQFRCTPSDFEIVKSSRCSNTSIHSTIVRLPHCLITVLLRRASLCRPVLLCQQVERPGCGVVVFSVEAIDRRFLRQQFTKR